MATYKTPDVYVEEISLFPPSVAEVETAIPAFIGYTQAAKKLVDDDLHNMPTRISSMLDYEKYFGYGPEVSVAEVIIDDNGNFKSSAMSTIFYMYDSLRLFYANGGGDCYIVSVGLYEDDAVDLGVFANDPIAAEGLLGGLGMIEMYDEPTIILYPDAVSLDDAADLYGSLQAQTLGLCNKLKDRVGLFDLLRDDPNGTAFRDNVGINYLKYGAAYTPWLKVSLPKNITYATIRTSGIIRKNSSSGPAVTLKSLTADADMQEFIQDYDDIFANETSIGTDITSTFAPDTTLRGAYNTKVAAYNNADPVTLHDIFAVVYNALDLVDNWTSLSSTPLADGYKKQVITTFNGFWQTLVGYEKAAEVAVTGITGYDGAYDTVTMSGSGGFSSTGGLAPASAATVFGAAATDETKMDAMKAKLAGMFEQINTAFNQSLDTLENQKLSFESSLLESFSVYKAIIKGLEDAATEMPPSGAVAGVYAATDRDRGVWKAPANVSLASVVGPTTTFTASQLDALNIDVNAGKSINAIRTFTGKGTLIWGARTLAGNDNEWRYIPVRRFYNMVEESIKKSTYWAVFEPNSANTWVKVKGMIDNYLTNKWKDGALVGAKPDDAFFVKIGLGTTMSAQDILEGRMNVEIGMAVVRPAEFIIIKFSHLLQKS
ncbi:hypothetical protein BH11BAC7_BH11BAC7_04650 [soil metagenome]